MSKLRISCIAAGVAGVGCLGIPATASADREFCCWRVAVQAKGGLSVGYTAREAREADLAGFKEYGDFDGVSRFNFVWESRGLYRYEERGRAREPSFENLFMGRRSFARAARDRAQLNAWSNYCIYQPVSRSTGPNGERAYTQDCDPPPEDKPCEARRVRPWRNGSGVQIAGRRGKRKIAVDVGQGAGSVFPPVKCRQIGFHSPSYFQDHGVQGPEDYALPMARSTGAALRGRRSFAPDLLIFDKTLSHPDSDGYARPHNVAIKQTVKIKFVYFPKRRLRAERRALAALR